MTQHIIAQHQRAPALVASRPILKPVEYLIKHLYIDPSTISNPIFHASLFTNLVTLSSISLSFNPTTPPPTSAHFPPLHAWISWCRESPENGNIPSKDSCFSFPYSVPATPSHKLAYTSSPQLIVSIRRGEKGGLAISCKHPWLDPERFPQHDGGVWVVFLHGGVGAGEE